MATSLGVVGNNNGVAACPTVARPSSSSATSNASSCGGGATLVFGSQSSTLGWREGVPAGEFGKQLRVAVLHMTGLTSLEGVELELDEAALGASCPVRVTPRDLFGGRFGIDSGRVPRIRIITPTRPTVKAETESSQRQAESVTIAAKRSVSFPCETPQSEDVSQSRSQPQKRAAAPFQKSGGSQIQFMQLMAANKNPLPPLRDGVKLTVSEVARHRRNKDCWTIYQGKVYDITLYMDFHPGSKKELMKGAGNDCTELFNQIHPWVSIDGILGKLCLGPLVIERTASEHDAPCDCRTSATEAGTCPKAVDIPATANKTLPPSVGRGQTPSSETFAVCANTGYPVEK